MKSGVDPTNMPRQFCLNSITVPGNLSWLEVGKLAGCARPQSEAELEGVKTYGIRSIVSLASTSLSPEIMNRLGFSYLHSPISGAPSIEQVKHIMDFMERSLNQSKPVLVHCAEGKGRTGTILAAYLVSHGVRADDAIEAVRQKRPGSIQSVEQENAVHEFEQFLRAKAI